MFVFQKNYKVFFFVNKLIELASVKWHRQTHELITLQL